MAEAGSERFVEGDGYAVGSLDTPGDGYGFRKVRRELAVTAFGVNAIVLPGGCVGRDGHLPDGAAPDGRAFPTPSGPADPSGQ